MKTQKSEKTASGKVKSQGRLAVKRTTLLDMKVKKDVRGGRKIGPSVCN